MKKNIISVVLIIIVLWATIIGAINNNFFFSHPLTRLRIVQLWFYRWDYTNAHLDQIMYQTDSLSDLPEAKTLEAIEKYRRVNKEMAELKQKLQAVIQKIDTKDLSIFSKRELETLAEVKAVTEEK